MANRGKSDVQGDFKRSGGEGEGGRAELALGKMLRCRVRCSTYGAVIGSKVFVNEAFAAAREQFTEKCRDGARRMQGAGNACFGEFGGAIW
jgi:hypothetical protein